MIVAMIHPVLSAVVTHESQDKLSRRRQGAFSLSIKPLATTLNAHNQAVNQFIRGPHK
jgi:hypothetical protein